LEDDFKSLIKSLKSEQFDVILDLHNNLRTRRLALALGVKRYKVDKLNIAKWLLVNLKIDRMPNVHIVDRYLHAAKPLHVTNDNLGLDYTISPEVGLPEEVNLPDSFVCYAIGGQHATKKMPVNKMIELCSGINRSVILIGGKEDVAAADEVVMAANNVVSLCGQLSISQSALILQRSDWVVSHDTGMMHIAAAFGKKVISIWGNTVPSFGMFPYKPDQQSEIFEVTGLSCRPCSKIGHDQCPKGHFDCMNTQNIEKMAQRINQ